MYASCISFLFYALLWKEDFFYSFPIHIFIFYLTTAIFIFKARQAISGATSSKVPIEAVRTYVCTYLGSYCMCYITVIALITVAKLRRPRWSRIRGSRVRSWPVSMGFFSERKNPKYDFLREGSKAVGPVL